MARHTGIDTTRVKVLCFAHLGLGDGAGRRRAGAALPLYRRQHRLQQHLVVPGADRRAARRPDAALGAGARRRSAGAAVGLPRRHLPAPFRHRARPVLRRHRLFPARRHRPAARARLSSLGRGRGPSAPGRRLRRAPAGSRPALPGSMPCGGYECRDGEIRRGDPAQRPRPAQGVRRARRRARSLLRHPPRRHHRPDRPERLGQDHRPQSHHRRVARPTAAPSCSRARTSSAGRRSASAAPASPAPSSSCACCRT